MLLSSSEQTSNIWYRMSFICTRGGAAFACDIASFEVRVGASIARSLADSDTNTILCP